MADELRHEHFALLRDGVEESGGREVKNMGDGLMFVFPSTTGAVDSAIAMQQRLEKRNRGAGEQLLVRIGIGMGEATVEDGDYFGMPTIEAARLCDKAGAAQILTGQLVKMMTSSRKDCFESIGTLELKGIPDDYEAFEVTWQSEAPEASDIPLPALLRGVPPVGYVGRDEQRELMARMRDEARDSRRLMLLSGEPGIGKTRLSSHTALEAHGEGDAVLFGRCTEEMGAPYAPWIEGLSHLVAHAPEDVLRAHVERHGGELDEAGAAARRAGWTTCPSPRRATPTPSATCSSAPCSGCWRRPAARPRWSSSSTTFTGPTRSRCRCCAMWCRAGRTCRCW